MIRVFKTGRHVHRTPLSYPALAPLWEGKIELADRPEEADLYLFSHVPDLEEASRDLVLDWRRRRRPIVLLSEEPFWDTIWGKRPMDRLIYVETAHGALPVYQINHQTSDLFAFDRIPYYLLTNPRFERAYRAGFARNARLSPRDWQENFADRVADVTFMFERRPEPWHDVTWPEGDVIGLCAWRTRLAEASAGPRVEKIGRSWGDGSPRRQDLTDWHHDKLTQLDRHSIILSGLENTHQPQYISEKFFDALVCGAIPLYYASSGHRLHDFHLPPDSWVNLFGLEPEEAATRIHAFRADLATFEAYSQAQGRLAEVFGNEENWIVERARLAMALIATLEAVL